MGKEQRIKELERRVAAMETENRLGIRAENELNRRIDKLVTLVSELDASRDKSDNRETP